MNENPLFWEAYCSDPYCNERLVISDADETTDCSFCGRTFPNAKFLNNSVISQSEAEKLYERASKFFRRSSTGWIRTYGLSSIFCKSIAFMFTKYRLNEENETIVKLNDLNYTMFKDLAFAIDEIDLLTEGYGRDRLGSVEYLANILSKIHSVNGNYAVLEPLHTDQAYESVHFAISRALVGREVYFQALENGVQNFYGDNEVYFNDLLFKINWNEIFDQNTKKNSDYIRWCFTNLLFLSNFLRRPIVLLDAIVGNFKSLASTFLPTMFTASQIKAECGNLQTPIVIAWANADYSYVVPLVGVNGRNLPRLHRTMLPLPFGANANRIEEHIEFEDDFCLVSTGNSISPEGLFNSVRALGEEYKKQISICPFVLCNYAEDIMEIDNFTAFDFSEFAIKLVEDCNALKLWRCLICWRLSKSQKAYDPRSLKQGGSLFNELSKNASQYSVADDDLLYSLSGHLFRYHTASSSFVPVFDTSISCSKCCIYKNQMRIQMVDGSVLHNNGDHTRTPAPAAKCKRKMKHFYNGVEYDSKPINISFEYGDSEKLVPVKFDYSYSVDDDASNQTSVIENIVEKIIEKQFSNDVENVQLRDRLMSKVAETLNSSDLKRLTQCSDPVWLSDGSEIYDGIKTPSWNNLSDKFSVETEQSFYNPFEESKLPSNAPNRKDKIAKVRPKKPTMTRPKIKNSSKRATKYLATLLRLLREKFAKREDKYWSHVLKSAKMFAKKGVIYRLITDQFGKTDGQHYTLPGLFGNQVLVFSSVKDRCEICISKKGHFEINESLKDKLDKAFFNQPNLQSQGNHEYSKHSMKIIQTASCTNL